MTHQISFLPQPPPKKLVESRVVNIAHAHRMTTPQLEVLFPPPHMAFPVYSLVNIA
jgi:hypothetical protein